MSKKLVTKSSKSSKSSKKYYCKYCDYVASQKSNYEKHLATKRHNKNVSRNCHETVTKCHEKSVSPFSCEKCGKNYKSRNGLWYHQKKCQKTQPSLVSKSSKSVKSSKTEPGLWDLQNEVNGLKDEKIKILEKNNEELKEMVKDLMTHTASMTKYSNNNIQNNTYNNCTNKMTINVFLNEQCKDALNLTDFVENIKVTLEDLEYSKDNGFVNGVTNIIKKQLQDMKPTERPIHCSDKKRLQFYVKDNDKWQKDEDNKKLDETIRDVKLKLPISLTEWEKANPTYKNDPKLMDEWMNIMTGISEGDTGNILKEKLALKRKLANYMELKEAMAQSQEEK
tara:strand:- start:5831 stop:6841 length:1011 start_codon:yes stop_codon:yes gene_type:complete